MTDRIQTQNDESKTAESFANGKQTHNDLENSFITGKSIIQREFFDELIERTTDTQAKLQMRLSDIVTRTNLNGNSKFYIPSGKTTKMSLSKDSQIGQTHLHASSGKNRGSI